MDHSNQALNFVARPHHCDRCPAETTADLIAEMVTNNMLPVSMVEG